MNNIESMSYVTYEYNVCPRMVEKHVSSNIAKTILNGADVKVKIDAIKLEENYNIVLFKINVKNEGNRIAKDLQIINTISNANFIKETVYINGYKIENYDLKNGFFLKFLNPKNSINITFKAKVISYGDVNSIVSGIYYFINDKNKKIYRKVLSKLNKITLNYSNLLFDIKYNNKLLNINDSKNITVILKNIGNKEAEKIKFNVLLPNELLLDYDSIFVNEINIIANDRYSFSVGNLKENESCKINFNVNFVAFKNRYKVPVAIFCSFYNVNKKNLYQKFDSEVLKFYVDLLPSTIR